MNKTPVYVIITLLIIAGGFLVLNSYIHNEKRDDNTQGSGQFKRGSEKWMRYQSEELGLVFEYREEPDGYLLQEIARGTEDPNFIKEYILTLKKDYEDLKNREGGEGPPTINVFVFKNTEKQWPQAWADDHRGVSNIGLKQGNAIETAVAGAKAIRYNSDGLYLSDNVVIAHDKYIFVISGAYLEEDSIIRNDFEPFLNSIKFVVTNEQIVSFDDCAAAGYPIMESYPRQCRTPDGRNFVEDVNLPPAGAGPSKDDCLPAGCSGQICADAEEAAGIITTCEYRSEYACYDSATCERQADGRCGWTQTPELKACLANPPDIR
jgi:eight-cysteine-cluster-containing protein